MVVRGVATHSTRYVRAHRCLLVSVECHDLVDDFGKVEILVASAALKSLKSVQNSIAAGMHSSKCATSRHAPQGLKWASDAYSAGNSEPA